MSESRQNALGGAISTRGTDAELARQQDIFGALRALSVTEPGPVSLDPMSEDAMEILRNWPAGEQGRDRATCTAFAVLSMVELNERLVSGKDKVPNYSEEFLYSMMRRKHLRCPLPPNVEEGSCFMIQAAAALESFGVCEEKWLPYDHKPKVPDFIMFPSPAVEKTAQRRKFAKAHFTYIRLFLNNKDGNNEMASWREKELVDIVRRELRSGRSVAASFPIYRDSNQWTVSTSTGWRRGNVVDPKTYAHVVDAFEAEELKTTPIIGGHAVCIVGYREGVDGAEGRFVFRNSWGRRFAAEFRDLDGESLLSLPDAGYGTISASHLENHCWELMFKKRSEDDGLPGY